MIGEFKCYNFKYDNEELLAWKQRDSTVVPQEILEWKGEGVKNGYGYGEFWVERYLINKGYKVISGSYNLSTDKSKYKENNRIIEGVIGSEIYNKLIRDFRCEIKKGKGRMEQSDMFAYKDNEYMFIEVKKDKDFLREPQKNFGNLLEKYNIKFVLFNLQSDIH